MARSSECTEQYAQKVFDSADIVRDGMLRQLSAHLVPPRLTVRPPLVGLLKVRHSHFGDFIGRRSIVESEPMTSTQPWPVSWVYIPCSDSIRRDMLTARQCEAIRGALGNFDHKAPAPAVELNCQKVDAILRGPSEVRQ